METSLNKRTNHSVCISSQTFFVLRRIHYSSCTKFVKTRWGTWAPCATFKQQNIFHSVHTCTLVIGQGFEMSKYVIPNTALFLSIVRASLLLTNERAERMSAAIGKLGSAIGNLRHVVYFKIDLNISHNCDQNQKLV